ncbi:MAG: universal stress protein [Bacillota bacterium]
MFKKILVPIDGSDVSIKSLRTAARMGEIFGSEITIIHVMQFPSSLVLFETYNGKLGEIHYQLKERVETLGEKILENAEEICMSYDVRTREKSVWGEPANEILQEAIFGNYDLVVIGSRGSDEIEDWLLGSVCQRVVRRANCPVLVIR